jgi:hypothetical protein
MERDSKLPTTIVELEHRGVESSQWTVDKYVNLFEFYYYEF